MARPSIKYRAGYKYQLHDSYSIALPWISGHPDCQEELLSVSGATLTILPGYAWDGASGPTVDSPSSMRGSLVHDALYQLMRMGVLPESCRPAADKVFYRLCIEDGMDRFRAWVWYWAVRLFAASAARRGTDRPVLSAPGGGLG